MTKEEKKAEIKRIMEQEKKLNMSIDGKLKPPRSYNEIAADLELERWNNRA